MPILPAAAPLELLHPDGATGAAVVIAGACRTPRTRPRAPGTNPRAELILFAPTAAECRSPGWLGRAVASLAEQLAADGVGYVLVPGEWRSTARKLLTRHGLVTEAVFLHVPRGGLSYCLVPLQRAPLEYALATLVHAAWLQRAAVWIALRLPGGTKLLLRGLPTAALAVRRPGARRLFAWLGSPGHGPPPSAMITTSWRGPAGAVIVQGFAGRGATPSVIAKVTRRTDLPAARPDEAAILAQLGPAARQAGANVPRLLGVAALGDRAAVLETAVGGQMLAPLLAAQRDRLPSTMRRLARWVAHWNAATCVLRPLAGEEIERELLRPAALLAPLLEGGDAYVQWLTVCWGHAAGVPLPRVATHGDLTAANISVDRGGRLGVVDWEMARADGLPLGDFFYSMVDLVLAAGFAPDRLGAFQACFTHRGQYAGLVFGLERRLRATLSISARQAEFCFHACWVGHAANEVQAQGPAEARSFLPIVQWLARHRGVPRS